MNLIGVIQMIKLYSAKQGVASAGIGGVIAGIVMIIPMMSMMNMMNLPPDMFSTIVGMAMGKPQESAAMTGTTLHFVPSILIGLLFGAIVSSSKFAITSFKKGIPLGIAAGIVSFVILFLPMMINIMPPIMMQLMQMMNPGASQEMIMSQLQSMQPMLLAGALFAHIVYGIVLGTITTAILKKTSRRLMN